MSIYSDRSNPSKPLLLTARQTAEQLNISERHLYTLTQAREIGCVRVGRKKLYTLESIQQFIRDHSMDPCGSEA